MLRYALLGASFLAGCDPKPDGVCFDRCEQREQQSTSACAQAAGFFLPGEGSPVQPTEATIFDFDLDSPTQAVWSIDCECFSDPPELHVARADSSGVTEIEPLEPVRLDFDSTFVLAILAVDAVTPGSTWAMQAVDADGRRTEPFCATTAFKGE